MQFSKSVDYAPIASVEHLLMNLASPFTGKVYPLSVHPETLLATSMLGRGVCVEMTGNKVTSPISGTIEQIKRKGCEFIIVADNGLKLMVHVHLPNEYNTLGQQAINAFGKKHIEQGEILAYFDLPSSQQKILGTLIVLNADKLGPCYYPLKQVSAGQDPLLSITKKQSPQGQ
ncbi:PTS system glucose-specific EIIA component [Pseudoalteromonas holothuriae]|uniref:PTS system glucose-specific EIIA component n=1 Tax=Pseudoalteromonas holothuriae TaxID=2963714 RepID=A0A9W4QXZ1_9GAMM|nr:MULTISPECIES: PTS glucose transporter subunit IIA [unclassified Pseudoalteromonas]CAH9057769.1 PTS system glucose-specific EIIA component [Pseudoalteromonas sp. CIP111951]CAH9058918.1 PTS system glucose-specific EIIA component [Pseudoalteromonas sp. CIP111854]